MYSGAWYTLSLQAISTDNGATWTLGYNVETESGIVKEVNAPVFENA